MIRTLTRIGIAALVVGFAGSAGAQPGNRDPVLENPEGARRVSELLAAATTRQTLNRFTGTNPERCVATADASEICEWHLGKAEPGFEALARAIDTDDRVALLCEVPTDGRARTAESCNAYPRRSNRVDWYVQQRAGHKRGAGKERPGRTRKRFHQMAIEALDSARTLRELCHLIGATPECEASDGQRLCVWRATARTYGHGTLSVAANVSKGKKLRLHCTLPKDGGPRGVDSCRIEVGT